MIPRDCDCLVIGGGPAGLTGALYLARFRRRVLVIDAGQSRAASIPNSHNHPGFIHGVSGKTLLRILRAQAEQYGAIIRSGNAGSLEQTAEGFIAATSLGKISARKVLLATGITDKSPDTLESDSSQGADRIRYCPVCDGFEMIDKKIGVIGPPKKAASKARFLRVFSPAVTLVPDAIEERNHLPESQDFMAAASPAARIEIAESGVQVVLTDGQRLQFDVLYPSLGCHVHAEIAVALGAKTNRTGCLIVDDKQRTSVTGLFAAGDVVSDLHQLVIAEAHAAIAATAIHNSLPLNLRAAT